MPVKAGIKGVKVFGVHVVLGNADRFTESLEMNQFPFPQKPDGIFHIGVIHQTENVVIGDSGFLFCCNCERTTYHVKQIGQAAFIHAKTEY